MKTQTKLDFSENEEKDGKFYTYPSHKVLGVFDRAESVKSAVEDLKNNGFQENEIEVISKAEQIDFSGKEHGFWGRIVRSFQHFGSEGKYLDRYEQELKDGHLLLTVVAKSAETKAKVKEILQSHGGHRLSFFGNWLIEGIPESTKTEDETHPYGYRREVKTPFDETWVSSNNRILLANSQ